MRQSLRERLLLRLDGGDFLRQFIDARALFIDQRLGGVQLGLHVHAEAHWGPKYPALQVHAPVPLLPFVHVLDLAAVMRELRAVTL